MPCTALHWFSLPVAGPCMVISCMQCCLVHVTCCLVHVTTVPQLLVQHLPALALHLRARAHCLQRCTAVPQHALRLSTS